MILQQRSLGRNWLAHVHGSIPILVVAERAINLSRRITGKNGVALYVSYISCGCSCTFPICYGCAWACLPTGIAQVEPTRFIEEASSHTAITQAIARQYISSNSNSSSSSSSSSSSGSSSSSSVAVAAATAAPTTTTYLCAIELCAVEIYCPKRRCYPCHAKDRDRLHSSANKSLRLAVFVRPHHRAGVSAASPLPRTRYTFTGCITSAAPQQGGNKAVEMQLYY